MWESIELKCYPYEAEEPERFRYIFEKDSLCLRFSIFSLSNLFP